MNHFRFLFVMAVYLSLVGKKMALSTNIQENRCEQRKFMMNMKMPGETRLVATTKQGDDDKQLASNIRDIN